MELHFQHYLPANQAMASHSRHHSPANQAMASHSDLEAVMVWLTADQLTVRANQH
jgi:hypothetical protein